MSRAPGKLSRVASISHYREVEATRFYLPGAWDV